MGGVCTHAAICKLAVHAMYRCDPWLQEHHQPALPVQGTKRRCIGGTFLRRAAAASDAINKPRVIAAQAQWHAAAAGASKPAHRACLACWPSKRPTGAYLLALLGQAAIRAICLWWRHAEYTMCCQLL